MAKYEVYYSYVVDAKAIVDAPDREAAEDKLEDLWNSKPNPESSDSLIEHVESAYDLEVAYAKRR